MNTKTMNVQELDGAYLDWAVAQCGQIQIAHEHFPTMTLNPRFKSARIVWIGSRDAYCVIEPENPMRQDPKHYSPSTEWELAGPIIESQMIGIMPVSDAWWRAGDVDGANGFGPTPLIAAMRCYVADKYGDEIEVPSEQE